MMWPPDGEKILMICLFVLARSRNVTHTDTSWRHRLHLHSITLQKSIVVRSCNLCSDLRDCCLIGCTDLMNIQQAKAASKASSLLSDDIWWNVTYWPAWQSPGTSVCHACNLFIEKFLLLLLVRCVVYTRIVFSSSRGVGVAEVGRLKMMVSVSISPLLMF